MTDWQKVKVTFTDADGNEASAVMWSLPDEAFFYPEAFSRKDIVDGLWIQVPREEKTIQPIRELPTGVGAVIRVSGYGDYFENNHGDLRDVYTTDASGQWWSNTEGDVISCESIKHYDWQYKILSEGIQL